MLKIDEIKPGQVVYIEWVDSCTAPGWQPPQYYKAELGYVKSVGIVVSNTAELLAITNSVNDEKSVLDPNSIPWAAIANLRVLMEL